MHDHDHEGECAGCAGRDILADTDAAITENGFNISCVFGSATSPGFVYTEGLSERGLHDLIFVGDHAREAAMYLFGLIAAQIDEDQDIAPGLLPVDHPHNPYPVPMWVVEAGDKLKTHAFGTVSRLQRIGSMKPPRLLQVVMPDKAGFFPWEPGYDWLDQKVTNPPVTGNA